MRFNKLLSLAPPFGGDAAVGLATTPSLIIATVIVDMLEKMSWPVTAGEWPLYVSYMPDVAFNVGAIYDTSGIEEVRQMDGTTTTHHGIRLALKGAPYTDVWTKLSGIASSLALISNMEVTVEENLYTVNAISRASSVTSQGSLEDSKQRFLCSMEFVVTITNG